jgi:outer membrane lipoprotein-sorting protein
MAHRHLFSMAAAFLIRHILALSAATMSADELTADDLVARINAVPDGELVTRKLSMELTDRRGKTRVRDTINYRKYFGDEKRTVIFFQSPANVRGTAFLIWDYRDPAQEDDQWLYLPALGKVRRVSAADRGDYFMGTDFTYEDIKLDGKVSDADYLYTHSADTATDSDVIKLEARPRSQSTAEELGYSKILVSVDPSNWVVTELEFWDIKERPLKHLVASDIRQVDGIWTRHVLEMENYQTGHRTRMVFSDVDYGRELADDLFTKQSLLRGQ